MCELYFEYQKKKKKKKREDDDNWFVIYSRDSFGNFWERELFWEFFLYLKDS